MMKDKRELDSEEIEVAKKLKSIFNEKQKERKFSQLSAALDMGWKTQAAVSHYLNGENPLNTDAEFKFAKFLEVEITDFDPNFHIRTGQVVEKDSSTPLIKEKIVSIGQATSNEQAMPIAEVKGGAAGVKEVTTKTVGSPVIAWEHASDLPEDDYVFIKRYDLQLSAGNGSIVYYEMEKTPQPVRVKWLNNRGFNPDNLVCLDAKGDSMEPAIKDKASIIIDLSRKNICDGDVYALRSGNEIMVKYLYKRPDGGIIIHSESSSRYPDIIVEAKDMEHIEVIGQVVNVSNDW